MKNPHKHREKTAVSQRFWKKINNSRNIYKNVGVKCFDASICIGNAIGDEGVQMAQAIAAVRVHNMRMQSASIRAFHSDSIGRQGKAALNM